MIDHNQPFNPEAVQHAAAKLVASGRWTTGEECAALEADFARLTGREGAVAVASGLSALRLALAAIGVSAGDEVIVPAYSCVALPNAVLALGAVPVAVDIDPRTYNLDVDACGRACSTRTKAITAVHTFGLPCNIEELRKVGPPVIEDCAHALGFSVKGRPIGSSADVVVTSFYSTKLVGAGQGGAVAADDPGVLERVRDFRDYTDKPPSAVRLNDRMTDICAVMARVQLSALTDVLQRRARLAAVYLDALADRTLDQPLKVDERCWYRFTIEVGKHDGCDARSAVVALRAAGVGAARPVEPWLGAALADYGAAAAAYDRVVSLPLYPDLDVGRVPQVAEAVRQLSATAT